MVANAATQSNSIRGSQRWSWTKQAAYDSYQVACLEAHHAKKRHAQPLIAIIEQPLIEECQERIQDGRVGLEDLINERNFAGWQVAINLPDIFIILQTCTVMHFGGYTLHLTYGKLRCRDRDRVA